MKRPAAMSQAPRERPAAATAAEGQPDHSPGQDSVPTTPPTRRPAQQVAAPEDSFPAAAVMGMDDFAVQLQ